VQKISSLLDKLDKKPAQVYLATVIGQLTLTDGQDLGVNWLNKFNRTGGNSGFSSSFLQPLNSNSRITGPSTSIVSGNNISDMRDNLITTAFGPSGAFNLYGQISEAIDTYVTALESTDRFKVISRPSVFALNNKKATITSGQSIPVPSQSTTNLNNNGNTITTTVAYKDVVLKLEVVPLINPNNEVTLTIAQVNDTQVGTQFVSPNNVPIISTEQIITTVTVPDKRTVVLGGLITDDNKRTTGGIPLISRIPGLGSLFKNDSKTTKRSELIIFIQPHVITDEPSLQAASNNEDMRTSIGVDSAKLFPTEATPIPPTTEPEKRKSWFKRIFDSDQDRTRPSDIHPLKRK
jgi:type II secretory pathway component GspD/PulD (secretin)